MNASQNTSQTMQCTNHACGKRTTQDEAETRNFNTGHCAYCGGNLEPVTEISSKESVKIIEVKSEVIDKLSVGAWTPESKDGKRYHLFVKIYRGNGLQKAAGVEFDNEDDAKMAQKLVHGVVNEVLA